MCKSVYIEVPSEWRWRRRQPALLAYAYFDAVGSCCKLRVVLLTGPAHRGGWYICNCVYP